MPGLPDRTVGVREIGDHSDPYERASSSDGIHLDLEPGELEPGAGGRCQLEASGSERWTLPDQTLVLVTNRRIAWLTTSFDQGGGWVGMGAVGLVASTTANAVSKRRAAQRSAGKVAVGHVRHEWVKAIRLRSRKALIGLVDTYVDIDLVTAQGRTTIELWGKGLANAEFARWLVRVVAHERLTLADQVLPENDREILHRMSNGEGGAAWGTGSHAGTQYVIPGDTDVLIDLAIHRHAPKSS